MDGGECEGEVFREEQREGETNGGGGKTGHCRRCWALAGRDGKRRSYVRPLGELSSSSLEGDGLTEKVAIIVNLALPFQESP